ncbi:MAG: hypothetical protein GY940_43535 [bacterium]|nr:hypothetical protein [bacterium]
MEGGYSGGKARTAALKDTKEKTYWLERFGEEDSFKAGCFPYDFPAGPGGRGSFVFNTSVSRFPPGLFESLSARTRGDDRALHIYLAAALAALLYKYNHRHIPGDEIEIEIPITLGTPIYRQEHAGEYINTILPLLHHLEPGMTFKQLLLNVRETLMGAFRS